MSESTLAQPKGIYRTLLPQGLNQQGLFPTASVARAYLGSQQLDDDELENVRLYVWQVAEAG